ncbi:MAG TPA: hypothetical protein VMB50_21020 [Myxococcales bacterium]|nr:hypothetical protein [Myxococcales bacterium]
MRASVLALAACLAACSGTTATDAGGCGAESSTCVSAADCCDGFTCQNGQCAFIGGNQGTGSSGNAATSGGTGRSTSGGTAAGTSGGRTSTGGRMTGGTAGRGSTGGTGSAAGSTGGGSTGGSTSCLGGTPASTEFQSCVDGSQCACGQTCVADPAFEQNSFPTACETTCQTNADCPNAASVCQGALGPGGSATCEVNLCDQGNVTDQIEGSSCDATAPGSADGTCIPQACADALICYPTGTAKACSPYTDGDPYYSIGPAGGTEPADLSIASPQPRQSATECPAGMGCRPDAKLDGGSCATICQPGNAASDCPKGDACVANWANCESWGYCGTCVKDGGSCLLDTDCCSGLCNTNDSCGCEPKGTTCVLDTDCCSGDCDTVNGCH